MLFVFGSLLVTGMVAHVVAAAAIGRRLTLGEAWAATRGKRWRLVGLAVLLWLGFLLALALYVVAWVVVAMNAPAGLVVAWGVVTVRRTSPSWPGSGSASTTAGPGAHARGRRGARGRGPRLRPHPPAVRRTLGIALLTAIVVGIASNVLAFPISMVGQVGSVVVGGSTRC